MPSQTIIFSAGAQVSRYSIATVELHQFGLVVPLRYKAETKLQGQNTMLTAHIATPLSDEAVFFKTPSWAVHVIMITAISYLRQSVICTVPVSLAPASNVGHELNTPLSDVLVSRWFQLWQRQQLSAADQGFQQDTPKAPSPNISTFKHNLRQIVDHHLLTHNSAAPTYTLRLNRWAATSWEDFQARFSITILASNVRVILVLRITCLTDTNRHVMSRQSEMGIPGLIAAPENAFSSSDSSKPESINVAAHASSGVHPQSLDWEAKGFVTPVQSQVKPRMGGIMYHMHCSVKASRMSNVIPIHSRTNVHTFPTYQPCAIPPNGI